MNALFDKYLHLIASAPAESLLYLGTYSNGLVLLSLGIAVFASYTALLVADFAQRSEHEHTRQLLLTLGGLALGSGIWAMHFVGMLGFSLPCGVAFDPWVTGLSMLPGVLASIFALRLISQGELDWKRLVVGGTLLGAGVGVMHYAGMAAMRMDALLRYDAWMFVLSIVVAVALAVLALWIRTGIVRLFPAIGPYALIVSAVVMGGAVSGMHYTAMGAAYFVRDGDARGIQAGFEPVMLAVVIAGVTGLIIGCVLIYVFRHVLLEMEQGNAKTKDTLAQLHSLVRAQEESVWIKSSSAQIVAAIQRQETTPGFARQLMLAMTPLVGAQVGVFYHFDRKTLCFSLMGSYGYMVRKNFKQHFRLGEGIVGQCAVERVPIMLSDLPDDYMHIASALGEASPQFVLAAPVIRSDHEIVAVVEFGFLSPPGPRERALFEEALPMIAISLSILENNLRTQHE